jgi:hypothetical protein
MAQTTRNKHARSAEPLVVQPASQETEVVDLGESPPTPPDADLWVEMGRKWANDGLSSIRSAASAMMTGLGAMQGIYLGIMGFAKFIPEDATLQTKLIYVLPLLPWMVALYHCLKVMKTDISSVNLNSPSNIRTKYVEMIEEKQHLLDVAFWFMFGGLAGAVWLVMFRLHL